MAERKLKMLPPVQISEQSLMFMSMLSPDNLILPKSMGLHDNTSKKNTVITEDSDELTPEDISIRDMLMAPDDSDDESDSDDELKKIEESLYGRFACKSDRELNKEVIKAQMYHLYGFASLPDQPLADWYKKNNIKWNPTVYKDATGEIICII